MQKSSIKYILKLSIPIFFANLAVPMVGIIDTALMGNLGNLSYLSATSVAANLFSMIFWSFGFLRMGTVGMVSQANGRNDYSEILNIVIRNLLFVALISIIIILLQNFILNLSLKIFDLSETTRDLYEEYFKIRVYSAPGELTLYIITGLFVGLQKTKTSSFAVGFFSLLNILISIVLVTKFNLNIKGVAYGTLLSALITSSIFLFYTFFYLSKFTKIKIDFGQILNLNKIKDIFNINLNIFIRSILLTFSFLFFTYLGNSISEDVVAANTILINLIMLSAFILDAYAFSTEGLVGYSIGSKNKKLLIEIIKNSFILSSSTGLIISFGYFLGKNYFIEIMTDLESIKIICLSYSAWIVIIPFISSFCYQFDGIFVGASKTTELRNAMIMSVGIYLLTAILLVNFFGNLGLWIALSVFFILRGVTLFLYLGRIYKAAI